jgi:hypothetical protein
MWSDAQQIMQPGAQAPQLGASQGVAEALDGAEGPSRVDDEQPALWRDNPGDGAGARATSGRTLFAWS